MHCDIQPYESEFRILLHCIGRKLLQAQSFKSDPGCDIKYCDGVQPLQTANFRYPEEPNELVSR